MDRLGRAAIAAVLVSGATAGLGLLTMDAMAARQDFQKIAELPRALSHRDGISERRATDQTQLGRTCIGYRCLAHIRIDSTTRSFGPAFAETSDLQLLRSATRKTLLLVADDQPVAVMDEAPSAWEWHDASMFDTGLWLGAVPALVFTSAFGWLVALTLFLGRWGIGQRLAVIARAAEGRVDDGWLRTSDASPPRRVDADNGDVLVVASPSATAPYRGDDRDAPFELLDGDREDNELPLKRQARKLDLATLAIAATTALPLMAAFVAALVL